MRVPEPFLFRPRNQKQNQTQTKHKPTHTMSYLTQYWQLKKLVLQTLLDASPASGDKTIVDNWFTRVKTTEAALETALADLDAKRIAAGEMEDGSKKPKPNRRSQRLLRLIQGAIKDTGNSSAFSTVICDLHPGNGGTEGQYRKAAKDTSEAAAYFLSALKSEPTGTVMPANLLQPVRDALNRLNAAAPASVSDYVKEQVTRLIASMDGFLDHGGGGDGSGYWRSTFISSSSSSGG